MYADKAPLDWGAAEALAFATPLDSRISVWLYGQDSQQGTFSHRHSVLHDVEKVKVPELGESINEVEIGEWLVEVGVRVRADDETVAQESDIRRRSMFPLRNARL